MTYVQNKVPLLPLRDIVVYPHMVVPLYVGREQSIKALEASSSGTKAIFLACQKNAKVNEPTFSDVYEIGTLAHLVQLLRLPDGTAKVLVEGKHRAKLNELYRNEDYYECTASDVSLPKVETSVIAPILSSIKETFASYAKFNRRISSETLETILQINDPSKLSDYIAVYLSSLKLSEKQEILTTLNPKIRLEKVLDFIHTEIDILKVERKIRSRVKQQNRPLIKDNPISDQLQALQRELGNRQEADSEFKEIETRIQDTLLSKEANDKIGKDLSKLKMMQPVSAEATVIRNYIDWVLSLPWGKSKEENKDLAHAEQILNEGHCGLEKVKDRILEYLAVQQLSESSQGPILCFVGPPGVGKTSLARSIAQATGRQFVRIALGGVHDEAEIRGHRRTYIGAMPGRILQSLKKVDFNNPVILLDEIDKVGSTQKGDPASALLEVLDPEQNHAFNDHFLELDYDLSNIMFLATANSLSSIPYPLRDRLEIIQVRGYTDEEKMRITQEHLIPRQRNKTGLNNLEISFQDEAIEKMIHSYTRESGVRDLERKIERILRKMARKVLTKSIDLPMDISPAKLTEYLGPEKFKVGKTFSDDVPGYVGLTTGLAYTTHGGTTLECEVSAVVGTGKLTITGLLEKGMKESAQAAMSYIRSRQQLLNLSKDFYKELDVHIHFPEFVPKDGPSAGITMATSIASALLNIPVRNDVAMTGEITLRGRILPIGGLQEKLIAAKRSQMTKVLLPTENEKDIEEVPSSIIESMELCFVSHMDEVLREALCFPEDHPFITSTTTPSTYS